MDFGIPTLIENASIEDCAELCRELNLQFIELSMDLPEYQSERIDADRFTEIAERCGVYYTMHLHGRLNPCDVNSRIAKAYTDTALQAIETAKRIAAPVVNMHFNEGEHFTLPDRKVYLFEKCFDEYKRKLTEFRDLCTAAVGTSDIKICVENTRSFQLDFVAEGIAILLESPVFALTFDTGHNAGNGFRQFPLIEKHINRLCHMHLHDYSNTRGDHLPLGEGDLDILEYLDIADKHNCRVLLETKTADGLRISADWLKRHYKI